MSSDDRKRRLGWRATLWQQWVKPIGVVLVVLTTFRSAVADWNDVPTQSMEPTILVGDRIFVNKLAYGLKVPFTTLHLARWSEPERGEIGVFYAPSNGKRMVKRVIGVPGDRISLDDGRLSINGRPVGFAPIGSVDLPTRETLTDRGPHWYATEALGSVVHALMFQPNRSSRRQFSELVVPDGQFFVMGDNRDNSGDSRFFGFVPRDQFVGKTVGIALSVDRSRRYRPRWSRFFRSVE